MLYIDQIFFIPKYTKKEYTVSSGTGKKMWPPKPLVQLSISMSGLDILDIEAQLNSLKIKWIQRLLNPKCPLEKSHAVSI